MLILAWIYLFKVKNDKTRTLCEICLISGKKRQKDIIDLTHYFDISNIDFEQVHTEWGNFY